MINECGESFSLESAKKEKAVNQFEDIIERQVRTGEIKSVISAIAGNGFIKNLSEAAAIINAQMSLGFVTRATGINGVEFDEESVFEFLVDACNKYGFGLRLNLERHYIRIDNLLYFNNNSGLFYEGFGTCSFLYNLSQERLFNTFEKEINTFAKETQIINNGLLEQEPFLVFWLGRPDKIFGGMPKNNEWMSCVLANKNNILFIGNDTDNYKTRDFSQFKHEDLNKMIEKMIIKPRLLIDQEKINQLRNSRYRPLFALLELKKSS
jgi:hypothetical protein